MGKIIGSLDEDLEGRAIVCWRTSLPPPSDLDKMLGLAAPKEDVVHVLEGPGAGVPAGIPS